MFKVIAIVVTYNGESWIRRCLSSLLEDETVILDVLVIDNCSHDCTASLVKNEFPSVTLIELNSNLGFGRANNIGLEMALKNAYDCILLLNQDAWISKGSIGDLARLQQCHREYGIISPVHLTGDEKTMDRLFAKYVSPPTCHNLFSDALLGKLDDLYEAMFINAAAWLISRECLQKVGGFDPIFPHYGEDRDYTHRVRHHGYKIGVTPTGFICHDRPQSPKGTGTVSTTGEYITSLVDLKRIDLSMRFAVSSVFRNMLARIITLLLYGRFKNALNLLKVMLKLLFALPQVKTSRSEQSSNDRHPYLASSAAPHFNSQRLVRNK